MNKCQYMPKYCIHEFNQIFKMFCMVLCVETKILQLKRQKNILLCACWPLNAAMLSSETANQEEDKICFFFFIEIIIGHYLYIEVN